MASVLFPDNTYGNTPKDGEYFYHLGIYYKWDSLLGKWRDPSGAFWVAPLFGIDANQTAWIGGSLPLGAWQTDGGGEAIKTIPEEKSSGDKLKTFFFGDNSGGCECGAWTVGSPGHSDFCKLYTK